MCTYKVLHLTLSLLLDVQFLVETKTQLSPLKSYFKNYTVPLTSTAPDSTYKIAVLRDIKSELRPKNTSSGGSNRFAAMCLLRALKVEMDSESLALFLNAFKKSMSSHKSRLVSSRNIDIELSSREASGIPNL